MHREFTFNYRIPKTLLGLLLIIVTPRLAFSQSIAKATLDGSGKLVLSATYYYDPNVPTEYSDLPWIKSDHTEENFIYFDLRMSDYDNGYSSSISNLSTRFPSDPTLPVAANRTFIQDAYFMGLFDFGDSTYGQNSTPVPDIEMNGRNTYYASAVATGMGTQPAGNYDLKVVLPFDGSSSYETDSTTLDRPSGVEHSSAEQQHPDVMGFGTGGGPATGKWISTGASTTIKSSGLVTGKYEFVVYTEFHEKASTNILIISAYQKIAYVRFTLIDEDTTTAPSVTIADSTTYIGEANLATGSSFVIQSGAHVDFIVSNGHGITFNSGFEAQLGSSFKTELGGGTSLSKSGGTSQYERASDDSPVHTEVEGRQQLSVYPNPASRSATLQFVSHCDGPGRLSLFDILGRKIGDTQFIRVQDGVNSVGLGDMLTQIVASSGHYFIRIDTACKTLYGSLYYQH